MFDLKNLKWPDEGKKEFIYNLLNHLHNENWTAILKNGQVLNNLRAITTTAGSTKIGNSVFSICDYFVATRGHKSEASEVVYYDPQSYASFFPSSFLEKVFKPEEQKKEPEKKKMTAPGEVGKVADNNKKTAEKVQTQKNKDEKKSNVLDEEDYTQDLEALFGSEQILTMIVGKCCRDGLSVNDKSLKVPWCKQCRLETLNAKKKVGTKPGK